MSFILNNVRKPNSVGTVLINVEYKNNHRFNMFELREALESKSDFNSIKKYFTGKDLEVLENIAYTFKISKTPHKICIMVGSFNKEKSAFPCNIYMIELKNLIVNECKFAKYGIQSDDVVISPKAWFDDQKVYNTKHKVFFDKENNMLVTALHPKDINELKSNPLMFFIGEANLEEDESGQVILKNIQNLKVLKSSDREKRDLEERNKHRLLGVFEKQPKNKDHLEVVCIDEKEVKTNENLIFSNISLSKLKELPLGKYRLFLTEKNKEVWFVIDESVVLGEKQKHYAVLEQGIRDSYLDKLKERKPARFFNIF